jgi:DNA polymerase III delta subunit
MKKEHLETEAILGLAAMRSELSKYEDQLPTLTVMQMICSAMREVARNADKGEYGALAVKSLFRVWQNLKFQEVTGANISELNKVVEAMYAKTVAELRKAGAS